MLRALPFVLIALLAGCAASGGLTQWEAEQLARREGGIASSTRRVFDAALDARIAGLIGRIAPGLTMRVYVVQDHAPQAEVIGGSVLVVRTGLLEAARSEDELAFVLAHELAHTALGHIAARRDPGWDALAAEIAADEWAVDRLLDIGLDAGAGGALLTRLLPQLPEEARPMVERRCAALAESAARVPPYEGP
jgi:hypothetical protein